MMFSRLCVALAALTLIPLATLAQDAMKPSLRREGNSGWR